MVRLYLANKILDSKTEYSICPEEKKENHVAISVEGDPKVRDIVIKEIQETINELDRLLKDGISLEIHYSIDK